MRGDVTFVLDLLTDKVCIRFMCNSIFVCPFNFNSCKVRRMRSHISVPQKKDDSCNGLGDTGNDDLELLLLNGIYMSQTVSSTHYIKHTQS